MRIDVKKFLFMGAVKDKHAFFKEAQSFGIIEFINPLGQKLGVLPESVDRLSAAIKILRGIFHEAQDSSKSLYDAEAIAELVVETQHLLGAKEEEKRVVLQEIERIQPFGTFSLNRVKEISEESKLEFRFFTAKSSKHLATHLEPLILVNQKEGLDYFIAIQNEPLVHPELVELHFTESLDELTRKLEQLVKEIEHAHEELKTFTRYDTLLHQALLHRINEANLAHANNCSEFELENQLFFVEGWVPVRQLDALKTLAKKRHVYIEEIAQDVHDKAPTYLENKGVARVGEDLVRVFDTPANNDKDPSLWVLFAFALFFSMIIYDAGYGIIFLLTALYLHFKTKKASAFAKRFVMLLMVLGIASTLWGGLTHSFFGIELSPENPLRKYSLMTYLMEKKAAHHMQKHDDVYTFYTQKYPELLKAKTAHDFVSFHQEGGHGASYPVASKFADSILMELALLCGAVHIIFGMLRYLGYKPEGAGWIAFICGAYLYIPYYLQVSSIVHFVGGLDPAKAAEFGLQLLLFGLGTVLVISVISHGFAGLFECMHAIQVFADILSYLRLYALGTAGFIVSETVNELSAEAPLILAICLLFIGHFLNVLLAVMGGTIHGLRLNFLEWYRYSFYGSGKEFQPLRLKTLE